MNPIVTFKFAQSYGFNSGTFYFVDADGFGGVSRPGSVSVNGANQVVPVNAGPAPLSITFGLTGTSTDTLTTQLFRLNAWVRLAEAVR